MRPITTYNPFQLKSETEMMGSPKNVPSMLNVEIVKLCSPLNQRVISLGLFPIASANCFFVIHFFCMSSSKRLEIWNESRASALSSGVMFRSSLNDVFALFITPPMSSCQEENLEKFPFLRKQKVSFPNLSERLLYDKVHCQLSGNGHVLLLLA